MVYMFQCFSKTEDEFSQAMNQAAKETFENNMLHHDTIKIIVKAYSINQQCSMQESFFHIFSGLKLKRIFAVFVLLTQIFQRKEFLYYFLRENFGKYQTIAQISPKIEY